MNTKKQYCRDSRSPIPKNEQSSKTMSAIKAKNTKPELILRNALWHSGVKGYRLHWKKVPGRPDIAFPGRKIAIFINGCYWHRCPICKPSVPKTNVDFWTNKFKKNVERDKLKIEALEDLGWTVFTIWECEIKNELEYQVEKLKKYILSQSKDI